MQTRCVHIKVEMALLIFTAIEFKPQPTARKKRGTGESAGRVAIPYDTDANTNYDEAALSLISNAPKTAIAINSGSNQNFCRPAPRQKVAQKN